ncbi:ATP-dependent Clp protease ATP-binding subunit [Candidatus Parcubacteria bacterium]|nr:ATP-dependent Clp protease ATP-binding subunit [Candidatus Parcubacteria bacterium]
MPDNINLDCFKPYIERANELAGLLGSSVVTTAHLLLAVIDLANEEFKSILDQPLTTDRIIEIYNLGALPPEPPALFREVLAAGVRARQRSNENHEEAIYLLMGVLALPTCVGYQILHVLQIQVNSLQVRLAKAIGLTTRQARHREAGQTVLPEQKKAEVKTSAPVAELAPLDPLQLEKGSILALAAKDLTLLASQGKIDPIIGRDKEIRKAMQVLMKRKKNNPVFVGEAGVGKTAVAEGIALELVWGNNVPEKLHGKRIFTLSLSSLTAGTQYRGQFEERLQRLIKELEERQEIIVFIDELHTVLGTGSSEGGLDAANILKPALARGTFGCIGATTSDEYRKYIKKDSALERRFQPITIDEPDEKTTLLILQGLREKYELYHDVRYSDKALEAAVKYSARYIHERNFPDKAIDVIDEAGSRKAMFNDNVEKLVKDEDIARIISEWTGVIVMTSDVQRRKFLSIKEDLSELVIGQTEAIEAVGDCLLSVKMGNQPIGSFLFLGPTGVGKTEVARKLAFLLFGSEEALIKFDMSEYQEKHQVSRLIGAPPGYVGYDDGGELIEKVRRKPYSVILFDEMEKAHVDVFDILLQVLDDGILTDSQGRKAYFRNTIVIMTTNITFTAEKEIGFGSSSNAPGINLIHKALLRHGFRLEFINRIDETIVFRNLSKADMAAILELRLGEIIKRVREDYEINLVFTESVKAKLINEGFSATLGARELNRINKRLVLVPLGKKIIAHEFESGDSVEVTQKGNIIEFIKA